MAVLLASGAVYAYSPEELEKECHKPKFTDFTLTEYSADKLNETPAEAEFSLKVQAFANPETIKLTIKKQPLPFTLESNSSFHKIKAKIPAELSGKFARLDVSAKVIEGECHEATGWLLKIADKAPASTDAAAEQAAPETTPPAKEAAPAAPAATTEATPATTETAPTVPATTEPAPAKPAITEAVPDAPAKVELAPATPGTGDVAPPGTEVVPTQ
jgi:hypothetical protein